MITEKEVFDKLSMFTLEHNLRITDIRGSMKVRIKTISELDGRCPCKPKERMCPCPESITECNTNGECYCRVLEKPGWDWSKEAKKPKKKGL